MDTRRRSQYDFMNRLLTNLSMNDGLISWMNRTATARKSRSAFSPVVLLSGQGRGAVRSCWSNRHTGSAGLLQRCCCCWRCFPSLPSLPRLSDVTRCVATPLVTSLRLVDQSATTGQFIFLLRHAEPAIFIDWFTPESVDCGRIHLRTRIPNNLVTVERGLWYGMTDSWQYGRKQTLSDCGSRNVICHWVLL